MKRFRERERDAHFRGSSVRVQNMSRYNGNKYTLPLLGPFSQYILYLEGIVCKGDPIPIC